MNDDCREEKLLFMCLGGIAGAAIDLLAKVEEDSRNSSHVSVEGVATG